MPPRSGRPRPAARTARRGQPSRVPLYVAAAVVLAAAVVAVVLATSSGDERSSTGADACAELRVGVTSVPAGPSGPTGLEPEVQLVTVDGAPLVPWPGTAGGIDCAIGSPAPAASGSSFDGSPVQLAPGSSPRTLVVFLAHWCPHCRREVPLLVEWLKSGQNPLGVDVVAVSTAVDPRRENFPPSAWLAGAEWPTPVLVDDVQGSVASAYGLTTFPYFVLIDGDGRVVDRLSGEIAPGDLGARVTEKLGLAAPPASG